ncbi:sensor histidine kinase [Actinospongicola halichondriae]|uniref:sensor histidine kinase n=1 Tax=Actinospongicola halichondriae TaxID=3236844 RepID=UPI003D55C862
MIVPLVAWTLALSSLALVPFTEPTWHPGQWYFLVDCADAIVFGAVASVLLARGRHPVAWLLALCAVGGGLAALGFQWSSVRAIHPDLPTLDPLSSMQNSAWVPGTVAVVVAVPWLVRSTPMRAIHRIMVGLGTLLVVGWTGTRLTDPFPWPDGSPITPLPVRSLWWTSVLEDLLRWQVGALCLLGYLAGADVVRRWARSSVQARRGLGWLAVAVILMTTAFVPLALPASWVEGLPVWFTPVLHLTSQLFFPAAVLVTVLGQRLDGLRVGVSRATVYGLLTGGVLTAYLAVVWALGTVLPDGTVPGLIGVAVVAAGVQPARRVLQRRVDHLVRGESATPFDALSRVGAGLGTAADERELADAVAESMRLSFRLEGVAIDVDWPTGARRLAQAGAMTDETVRFPLVVQQESVGVLIASPRPGERLDRATTEPIERMAPIVAATVQLVARTRALAESRARIAEARDEERRQLRRELHDGFGPALAGIGLGLQAARNTVAVDADAAGALLGRLATEIEERVEEVRTLARGLLPPVLEELGLVPAIEELAERHRLNEGLVVHVDVDDAFGAVDAELRSALYGIVAESVRNVVRHAAASTCTISLRNGSEGRTVVVRDDGVGIDPTRPRGVGLRSMGERADAIGARLTVEAANPGTVVRVCIPSPLRDPPAETTA